MSTDLDDVAQRFSEALLQPLADVGALLARAVDELNAEVSKLRRDVDTLIEHVTVNEPIWSGSAPRGPRGAA